MAKCTDVIRILYDSIAGWVSFEAKLQFRSLIQATNKPALYLADRALPDSGPADGKQCFRWPDGSENGKIAVRVDVSYVHPLCTGYKLAGTT